MPKYWGENYFAHWRFSEVGQKQNTEKKEKEKKKERLNNGENNGQATHGARKHAWRTQAAWANRYASRFDHQLPYQLAVSDFHYQTNNEMKHVKCLADIIRPPPIEKARSVLCLLLTANLYRNMQT